MYTKIKAGLLLLFLASLLSEGSFGQTNSVTRLFQQDEPMALRLNLSFKEIKGKTNDSTYLPSVLYYQVGGRWDSIKIDVRARGNFRKIQCFFTPLRLKIKKEDAKGTPFEGNKNLKLVLPCETSKDSNGLLAKEYVCYRLFEAISPYTFHTRLLNIDLKEGIGNKVKSYQILGFFIEDDDLAAQRNHAKVVELNMDPRLFEDTSTIRHDLFQYMIANTDWSSAYFHNIKVIRKEPRAFIPLAYDFDMSGFVNAPYATVDESLGLTTVRERAFRGFCRKNTGALQYVRKQYIDSEGLLKEIITRYKGYLTPNDFMSTMQFMDVFFETMKSDNQFKGRIIDKCRTK